MRIVTGLAAAALLALPALSAGAKVESAYTKIFTKDSGCKQVDGNEQEDWAVTRCPGHSSIAVFIGEGDLRAMVAYGMNAKNEVAFGQTFNNFNQTGDTIEWRLRGGKPFATILRWKIDGGPDMPKGEMLVVTQLDEGNQCWVAVVSASKNKDANVLARKAADELAGKGKCNDETYRAKVIGTPDNEIYPQE